MSDWQSERRSRNERLDAGSKFAEGKMVAPGDVTALLEAVVRPGDRICLEGDNQKQADFLAACLANADPKVLHDLHVVQSGIVLPEHIDLFEKGIAKKLDFSYSGPQSHAVPRVLKSGNVELGRWRGRATQFTPACATSRDATLRSRRPSKRMRRKPASTFARLSSTSSPKPRSSLRSRPSYGRAGA